MAQVPKLHSVPYAGMTRIRFDGSAFASQPSQAPQRIAEI
jgi:hypothetical protein